MIDKEFPLVGRDLHLKIADSFINTEVNISKMLILEGNSGTGKTYFAKNLMQSIYNANNKITSLYIDLSCDEFTTSLFMESLIYTSWNEQKFDFDHLLNLKEKCTFPYFLKRSNLKKNAIESVFRAISKSVELIPTFGKPLKVLFPEKLFSKNENDPTPNIMITLQKYLEYLTNLNNTYIIIDNYQFLPKFIRQLFESHVSRIKQNLIIIILSRTNSLDEESRLIQPFFDNHLYLEFSHFNKEEIAELIVKYMKCDCEKAELFSKLCYDKTNGNLKEIELFLRTYKDPLRQKNIYDISETIAYLPYIKKYLITITSLFPAGMKRQYVNEFLNHILDGNDESLIEETISDLIKIGYIIINSQNGQLVKPAHEKIITSSKRGLSDFEFVQIRQELLFALEELLNKNISHKDYLYLLHCFVGIFSVEQYKNKLNYVIRLIDIQYSNSMFHYIIYIYKECKEIITILPELSVFQMLDAFQKTAEIYLGLEAISLLSDSHISKTFKYLLFKVKYLIQSYHYFEALEIINTLADDNDDVILYKLNIYQHLSFDDKAKKIIETVTFKKTDSYFVILRNSAHYFNFQNAILNLEQVLNYFKQKNFLFGKSTVYNNLGVVYLWNENIAEAENLFLKSIELFNQISSNEVFEPYCNMAALCAHNGNFVEAKKYLLKALEYYPKNLLYDQILLTNNMQTLKLALREIDTNNFREELLSLYEIALGIQDPWLHFQIAYNLSVINKYDGATQEISVSDYLLNKLKKKKETGMEILIDIKLNDKIITLLFSLSPHWRY